MSRSGIHLSVPPVSGEPIDWAHLDRATLGDTALAREVLGLFDTQAALMAGHLAGAADDAARQVHGLKGAARGIGAWRVADAAQRFKAALESSADLDFATQTLLDEISTVRQAIATHLRQA